MATAAKMRRIEAVKLKVAGLSNEQIRQELGYRTCAAVRADIRKEMRDYARENVGEAVEIELARLDKATELVMSIINGALHISDDDEENKSASKALFAVDRLVSLNRARAALVGLDASQRGNDSSSDIDQWLAGLVGAEPNLDPDDILGEEIEEVEDLADD